MSDEEKTCVKNKKYELVAPDGGWGYMIWIAAIINYSVTTAFSSCLGMIFDDFWKNIGMGSTSVTFLNGIAALCVAISGFLTGPLLKIMSMRKLMFLASLVFNLGAFCTVFANAIVPFFITSGLLQGIGFGILYNLSCTVLNEYFVKKRLLAITVTQMITALSGLVSPQFVKWTLDEYGYRGTLLLISALSMHTFISAVLSQPVAWHMKKVEISEGTTAEMKTLLVTEKNVNDKNIIPIVTLTDTEVISNTSIEMKNGNGNVSPTNEKKNGVLSMISDVLDLAHLKEYILSSASIGLTISLFSDFNFVLMLPQAFHYDMGWDQEKIAKALSLIALGDLVTRILFIFLNKWLLKMGSQEIYIIGLIVGVIGRLGMLWFENVTVVLVFTTIVGASRCAITVLPPLVVSETVRPEHFASAMGMFMMLFGLASLLFGPVIGAVRDLTGSYVTVFYILTSCYGIVILFWSIELCYKRNKHKRHLQRDNSAKSCNTNKGK